MNEIDTRTASVLKRNAYDARYTDRWQAAMRIERKFRAVLGDAVYDAVPLAPKPRPYVAPAPVAAADVIILPSRPILTLQRKAA